MKTIFNALAIGVFLNAAIQFFTGSMNGGLSAFSIAYALYVAFKFFDSIGD